MEKRVLGRGLAALIPAEAETEAQGQVREVPLSQIVANPYQPRVFFDPLKLEELATSIREHGILQPLLLRHVGHERYEIVAGERRFRAAQQAGLTAVPALVKECTTQGQLELAVVENLQREDIGPLEAARAYQRLVEEFQLTHEQVAQRVGKSRASISNALRLLRLPEAVQESVERGEITEGHAVALLKIEDESVIVHAWQQLLKRRLNVRDTERLASELRESAAQALSGTSVSPRSSERASSAERTDPHEAAISDRLQQALGTKVTLRRSSGGAGRIEIEFYSEQELNRLIDLLILGHE